MTDQEFIYWLKETIAGRIDKKINYLAEKADGELMREYYYLSAVRFDGVKTGPTNNISDPVGNLAAHLADIQLQRKRNYIYFKNLKEAAENFLAALDQETLKFIKIFMNLEEGRLRRWQKKLVNKKIEIFKNKFVKLHLGTGPALKPKTHERAAGGRT